MNDADLLAAATIIAGAISSARMHWDDSQPDHEEALAAKCVSLAEAIAKARETPAPGRREKAAYVNTPPAAKKTRRRQRPATRPND
jgi:hypothetical protein